MPCLPRLVAVADALQWVCLMPGIPFHWFLIGALVLAGITGWQGYRMGYAASENAQRQKLLDQIEAGRKLEDARRVIAQERDRLARELEGAAYADPVVVERCLGAGRVQRLNAIR